MTTREKMVEWRINNKLTRRTIARSLKISSGLLRMIEEGCVTHPNIVGRIKEYYGFSDEEAEELLPENYRKTSDKYEPDKFVLPEPKEPDLTAHEQTDVFYHYLHDHSLKGRRS